MSEFYEWINKALDSNFLFSKGQRPEVCESGPYRFIRHPGYLGGLPFTQATLFIFGSLWALILTGISIILMFIRTVLEDGTLEESLRVIRNIKRK